MSDLGNLYTVYNDMHKLVYFTVKSREKLWGFLFCTVAIFYSWQGQSITVMQRTCSLTSNN